MMKPFPENYSFVPGDLYKLSGMLKYLWVDIETNDYVWFDKMNQIIIPLWKKFYHIYNNNTGYTDCLLKILYVNKVYLLDYFIIRNRKRPFIKI